MKKQSTTATLPSNNETTRLHQLTDDLIRYNTRYRQGEPSGVTDSQYDKLIRELEALERKYPDEASADSPTRRIGIDPMPGHKTVRHEVPMLSIGNVYETPLLAKYLQDIDKMFAAQKLGTSRWMVEHKVDGIALALVYENGMLISARTRGNGTEGEEVIPLAKTIPNIPLELHLPGKVIPPRVEIRGEVYMPNSAFRKWNARCGDKYANPRNAASGAMRLLDAKECARRPLRFMAHSIAAPKSCVNQETSQEMFLADMEQMGFETPRVQGAERPMTGADVLRFCETAWSDESDVTKSLDFETDGLVIKQNAFSLRDVIGSTSTEPKWAIALKVETYDATTELLDVSWQVGKLGQVTPVAELAPVEIDGTTVRRSTLHNLDEIDRLQLRIGDIVHVRKAGKIIPKVVGFVKRGSTSRQIIPPLDCPSCGHSLVTIRDPKKSTVLECVHAACPVQQINKVIFYASREGVDIDGFGEKLVESLFHHGMIHDFADLYALTAKDLMTIPRMGETSALKLIQALEKAKTPPLVNFLHGLTIPNVGAGTSKRLARHFQSLEAILSATESSITNVRDIGPITAASIYEFFHSSHWNTLMTKLKTANVKPAAQAAATSATKSPFAGMTCVVTGKLANYTRDEAERLIESLGGTAASGVSKNTNILIVGEKAGSKLDKAQKLGVRIVTDAEFMQMVA